MDSYDAYIWCGYCQTPLSAHTELVGVSYTRLHAIWGRFAQCGDSRAARARVLALLCGRQRSTRLPCSLRARAPRRAFARCEWPGLATGRPWTGSMQRFAGLSAARAHVPAHAIGQRSKAAALAHAPPRLFSWGLAGLGLPWVDPGPVRRKKATPPAPTHAHATLAPTGTEKARLLRAALWVVVRVKRKWQQHRQARCSLHGSTAQQQG